MKRLLLALLVLTLCVGLIGCLGGDDVSNAPLDGEWHGVMDDVYNDLFPGPPVLTISGDTFSMTWYNVSHVLSSFELVEGDVVLSNDDRFMVPTGNFDNWSREMDWGGFPNREISMTFVEETERFDVYAAIFNSTAQGTFSVIDGRIEFYQDSRSLGVAAIQLPSDSAPNTMYIGGVRFLRSSNM